MKKILLILATAALSLGSFAGNPDDNKGRKNDPDKYCAELKDGVLKVMHNNEEVTADITLSNGTKIHPDGSITREGGYTRMLKEGECVNMDGEIESGNPDNKDFNKDMDEPINKSKKVDKGGNLDRGSDPNGSSNTDKNRNMTNDPDRSKSNSDKTKSDPDRTKSSSSDEEPK